MNKKIIIVILTIIIAAGIISLFFINRYREKPVLTTVEKPLIEPEQILPEKPVVETVEKPDDKPIETPVETQLTDTGPRELYNFKINDIISLEFISGRKSISIMKSGTQWTVNNNSLERIDQEKVGTRVMDMLSMQSLETVSLSGSASEDWGINPSSEKIRIKTTDSMITLILGRLNSNGKGYFLQIEGNKATYLVKNTTGESLKLKLDDLRDREIKLFDKSNIGSMSIKNDKTLLIIPYKRFDIFRDDNYDFMLESPYNAYIPVNNEALENFLNRQKSLIQIIDFIDEGIPEDFGIDSDSPMLAVKDKSGKVREVLIGSSAGNSHVYGKVTGEKQIFTVNRKDLAFMDVKPFDLVDKRPLSIPLQSIDTFMVTTDEFSVIGTIDEMGNGRTYGINGIETEEKIFKSLYDDIQNLILSGETAREIRVSDPEIIISYKLKDGGTEWTHINFQTYDSGNYSVALNEEAPLFIINKSQMDEKIKIITRAVDKIMGF